MRETEKVRYRPGEKFTWHLDALPPSPDLVSKGGQRTATLLVYLTDLPEGDGGATAFRDLGPLRVRPRKVGFRAHESGKGMPDRAARLPALLKVRGRDGSSLKRKGGGSNTHKPPLPRPPLSVPHDRVILGTMVGYFFAVFVKR